MKIVFKTPEEKRALWERMNELIAEGRTRNEAEKAVGVGQTYYYTLKRLFGEPSTRGKPGRKPKVQVIDLPPAAPKKRDGSVFVFYGSPESVSEIVRSLQ